MSGPSAIAANVDVLVDRFSIGMVWSRLSSAVLIVLMFRFCCVGRLVVQVPNVSWNDVGGLEDVKRELQETVQVSLRVSSITLYGARPTVVYGVICGLHGSVCFCAATSLDLARLFCSNAPP